MTFNTALSGLSAASSDLRITGNNIANASTVGFKASRGQFADVYASTLLGSGSNQVGTGVRLANVAQQFDQGTISFTNNSLDLSIDGSGFFVLSDQGAREYTRAGMFGVDDQGFIVAPSGARVQGFTANAAGVLNGILGDLRVQTNNLAPGLTTLVQANVNLDAREPVLSQIGSTTSTTGASIGVAQAGVGSSTASVLETAGPPTSFNYSIDLASNINAGSAITPFNFSLANNSATFDVSLSGSSVPAENQTVAITLSSNVVTLQDLINDIRGELAGSGIGVDVRENPSSLGKIQFYSTNSGEASTISIDPTNNATFGSGVTRANVEAVLGGIRLNDGGGTPGSTNLVAGAGAAGQTGDRSSASFDITLSGAALNNGTTRISLDKDLQSVSALIADIRDDLAASGLGVDVREDPNNAGRLQFFSIVPGEASLIQIGNFDISNIGVTVTNLNNSLNLASGVTIPGIPAVTNGYVAQTVDVTLADGTIQSVTTAAGTSASQIASQFSSTNVPGVSATASTTATISSSGFNNVSGTLTMSVNGVPLTGTTLTALASAINTTPGLGTVSAVVDAAGDLVVSDQVGNDLLFEVSGGGGGDSVQVIGTQGANVTLSMAGSPAAAIGGSVDFTLNEGLTMSNPVPISSNLFGSLTASAFQQFQLNTFDPTNQETYNAASATTVFDSLGNPHTMSLYFVKERFLPGVTGQEENRWTLYTLIDGLDVGDPNPNLAPPQNTAATRASFAVQFDRNGALSPAGTDPMLISNWQPLDASGNQNGAMGPLSVLSGGRLPMADPATSSNFEIRLGDSTQYGTGFALNGIDQNGFAAGELSGLSIGTEGVLSARFTNGQSQSLGQIALADFSNVQGLRAVGSTAWIETNESGEPAISAPASGSLGAITSGALEDSNVELSEQLVQLLIAQRNFQANARTISTADEITQTIINL